MQGEVHPAAAVAAAPTWFLFITHLFCLLQITRNWKTRN